MTLPLNLVESLQQESAQDTWSTIFDHAWQVCTQPLTPGRAETEVLSRDSRLGDIDHYITTAGWDLWGEYENSVPRTSQVLANWWQLRSNGRAILILDALSLRETPWLLNQAAKRGYTIHDARPTGAELPADTTPFAKSLGFHQRSALENNGAGSAHCFQGARTDSVDIAWADCATLIGSEPDWVFWHHWPDHRLHDHDDPGKGLLTLTREVESQLTNESFWVLVDRLSTGRRLVITADHGYAASGQFPDSNKDESSYLKDHFRSGRSSNGGHDAGGWVPPIDIAVESSHGRHLYVNGRRKWKSQGGYPTLTHGGLTVLEVIVPFIELSRNQ